MFPLTRWIGSFIQWVQAFGSSGAVIYGLFYVAGVVLFFPGIILTAGAGLLYGVVLASGGYPDKYDVGKRIDGLESLAKAKDVHVFHAGTRKVDGAVVTSGGRVLAITALGENVAAARARVYEAVLQINFEGCHYRRDIALGAVAAKMVGY